MLQRYDGKNTKFDKKLWTAINKKIVKTQRKPMNRNTFFDLVEAFYKKNANQKTVDQVVAAVKKMASRSVRRLA